MYNPQLETFIRVADAGSFNKAAEELFISPPAVIKQINLLEAQLGLTLFVRTHRGLKLTEAGKSLYQDAKYVIGYCRESVERARAAMDQNQKLLALPQDMAREKNATLAQLSLAWMLCKKPWIVPIPGTRKLEQLRENAGAADVVLTPSEVSALDDALDTIPMSEVFGGSRIVKKC